MINQEQKPTKTTIQFAKVPHNTTQTQQEGLFISPKEFHRTSKVLKKVPTKNILPPLGNSTQNSQTSPPKTKGTVTKFNSYLGQRLTQHKQPVQITTPDILQNGLPLIELHLSEKTYPIVHPHITMGTDEAYVPLLYCYSAYMEWELKGGANKSHFDQLPFHPDSNFEYLPLPKFGMCPASYYLKQYCSIIVQENSLWCEHGYTNNPHFKEPICSRYMYGFDRTLAETTERTL